jgi:AraC-like DNA-binding protein
VHANTIKKNGMLFSIGKKVWSNGKKAYFKAMFDLYGIALLSPVIISSVFIVHLGRQVRSDPHISKKILLGFISLIFIICTSITIREIGLIQVYLYLDGLLMSFMLVIYPLFLLYIKSLTGDKIRWKSQFWHFFPALIVLAMYTLLYFLLDRDEAFDYLNNHILGESSTSLTISWLYGLFVSSKILHALQGIIYFIWGFSLLRKHQQKIDDYFSASEDYKLDWLVAFYCVYFVMALMSVASNLIPSRILYTTDIYIAVIMILLALFIMYIGIHGMQQQPVGSIILQNEQNSRSMESQALSQAMIIQKINSYVVDDKAFLNPELKIWDIVDNTSINRTYISQSINAEHGLSFNHYINKLRVNMACGLLKQNDSRSVENIAFECGFNSLSTFNRAFKRLVGQLPSQYR